ncbi:MAG: thiol-activated cytolysin family protein [Bacteroidales bacterium]|nr:thiol-activated cytolysin family protein [Bacteroidales bacterium]
MNTKHILVQAALMLLSVSVFAQTQTQRDLNQTILIRSTLETPTALTKTPYTPEQVPQVIVNDMGEAFELKYVDKDVEQIAGREMFATDETAIFPGAVVYADQDFADGRPTLVGLPVGTADIFVEFNTGSRTPEKQVKLTKKEVSNYIYSVLDAPSTGAGHVPPTNFNTKTHYCTSTSAVMYAIGCDAKYMKNNIKVDTKTTNNETKITTVQDFTQKYYTVSITPHPSTELYKYFGSEVTADMLKQRVGNRAIAVINSVTYGRRAFYFRSYHSKDMTFTGSQYANIGVGAVTVKATGAESIAKSSTTDDVFLFMLGGSTGPAAAINSGKTIREAFSTEESLKIGPSNQGVVLTYTARFLASGRAVEAKPAGKTREVSYVKMPKMLNWEIKNNARVAGECVKFKDMYNVAVVSWDDNKKQYYISRILRGKGETGDDRYCDSNEALFSRKGELKRRVTPHDDIVKKYGVKLENCYVYGPIYYTIRSRTAEGQKWGQSDSGYLDVSSCGGKPTVVIEGSALAGADRKPYLHSSSNVKKL